MYQIMSSGSGFTFGTFEGGSPAEALDRWAVSQGYTSYTHMCDELGFDESWEIVGGKIVVGERKI